MKRAKVMWNKLFMRAALTVLLLFSVPLTVLGQGTPLNETDLPAEADFCNIQFPPSITVSAGSVTPSVYGQIYEAGITEPFGPDPSLSAQLGYGPEGTNPWEAGWVWTNAPYNFQISSHDEYVATITAPSSAGNYAYCFRFSFDGMATATYADRDGAGSIVGNDFSVELMGRLTVDGPVSCCQARVGDANGAGGDEPTIGDVSVLIDARFITGSCDGIITCFAEADINRSGGVSPVCDDITIGDISILIDYLFITGQTLGLPDCL